MFKWISEWWTTFCVWRGTDAETWAHLTGKGHNPDDYIETERPL